MRRLSAWLSLRATNLLRWFGLLPPLEDGFPPYVGWDNAEERTS